MPSIHFDVPNGSGAANSSHATEIHTSGNAPAADAPCVDDRDADVGEAVIALMAAIRRTRARRDSMRKAGVVEAIPAVRTSRLEAVLTAAHRVPGEVLHAGN